jgi:hypothetical protein
MCEYQFLRINNMKSIAIDSKSHFAFKFLFELSFCLRIFCLKKNVSTFISCHGYLKESATIMHPLPHGSQIGLLQTKAVLSLMRFMLSD